MKPKKACKVVKDVRVGHAWTELIWPKKGILYIANMHSEALTWYWFVIGVWKKFKVFLVGVDWGVVDKDIVEKNQDELK